MTFLAFGLIFFGIILGSFTTVIIHKNKKVHDSYKDKLLDIIRCLVGKIKFNKGKYTCIMGHSFDVSLNEPDCIFIAVRSDTHTPIIHISYDFSMNGYSIQPYGHIDKSVYVYDKEMAASTIIYMLNEMEECNGNE